LSWLVHTLPFIEQDALYRQYDFTKNWNDNTGNPSNLFLSNTAIVTFICPSYTDVLFSEFSTELYPPNTGKPVPTSHYWGVMGPSSPPTFPPEAPFTHGGFAARGILNLHGPFRLTDITDGTSNTFAVGEGAWRDQATGQTNGGQRAWARSDDSGALVNCKNVTNQLNTVVYNWSNNFNDISFGSMHPGITNFLFADGSVRSMHEEAPLTLLLAAASRDGGEVVSID
jgi:prepilin-type processing-associated H-X9-DG protein